MEDGLLSLKWNNHKSTFFHILSGLRKKETYTDATLACEGKFFPVHKLVMSTCSDYFGEVFERTTCKSPVVILKDIRHHDLEALLDYMYLGEVDVKQSELAGLIKAAECLRIKGLAVPDEDPSLSTKKSMPVPEGRRGGSPAAKRPRRESGGSDGGSSSSSQYHSYGSGSLKGVRRSVSPTGSSASSRSHPQSIATSTSVPSQSAMAAPAAPDALHSQVPPRAMLPPSPAVTDLPPLHPSDGGGGGDSHRNPPDQNFVPVDMIKVEVEDEGNHHHPGNSQPLRHPDSAPDSGKGRDEPRGEGGGGEDDSSDGGRGPGKHPMANSFSDYGSHTGEIEKEEHDQIDAYNGSEQLAGPSGVQGAPQMMNWGEEEGNFPHNLFGGEDSSHQQVCIAIMEPELLAVRMFQGPKSDLANSASLSQLRVDNNPQIVAVEQPLTSSVSSAESTDPRKRHEAHFVIYQQHPEQLSKLQKPQLVQQVEPAPTTHPSSVVLSTPIPTTTLSAQVVTSSLQLHPQPHATSVILEKASILTLEKTPPTSQSKRSTKQTKTGKRRKNPPRHARTSLQQLQPATHESRTSILEQQFQEHRQLSPEQVFCHQGLHLQQENISGGKPVSTTVAKSSPIHRDSFPLEEEEKSESYPKLLPLQNLQEHYENQLQQEEQAQQCPQTPESESSQQGQTSSEAANSATPQDLSSRQHRVHFCHFCQYSSKSRVDLSKHIRVHTREKPYKCPMCKYETGDKSNYKRHVTSVHKSRDLDPGTIGEQQLPLPPPPQHHHSVPPLHPAGGASIAGSDVGNGEEPESQQQQSRPISIHAIEVVTLPYSEANLTASPTPTSSHAV